ncbi:MAG: DUF4097 domain-containing protein, partial [Saprospiraceae bacterium]|nr:DUF4097 domain-containing protein [Saprospiraceae bacterium]
MKNIYALAVSMLLATSLAAQQSISATQPVTGIERLKIKAEWGDVTIKSWNGNEIKVEGSAMINNGLNDEAFSYSFERMNDQIIFLSEIKDLENLPKFVSYELDGQKIERMLEKDEKFDWKGIKGNRYGRNVSIGTLIGIDLVVSVPRDLYVATDLTYGDVDLVDCQNQVDIKSTYGDVEAAFQRMPGIETSLTSTYGFVDVSVPSREGAQVSLHTNYGNIYSDLEVNHNRERSIDELYKSRIVGKLNQGGPGTLSLRADYG